MSAVECSKGIFFKPLTDDGLSYARVSLKTRRGVVKSGWQRKNGGVVYTFAVPENSAAEAVVEDRTCELESGEHVIG